ncbi:hypothetical protein Acy02nite_69720 [Actinoplanes cyaneus]|uniref:Uncharacterized protein n=1 Tax=Actinoplanes cyaneus TaxID=52696 RepID=A0A919IQ12_9ACTN|nr:hypothetical protein Acy02nite_69720 [Actinoplanes cyaneus]
MPISVTRCRNRAPVTSVPGGSAGQPACMTSHCAIVDAFARKPKTRAAGAGIGADNVHWRFSRRGGSTGAGGLPGLARRPKRIGTSPQSGVTVSQ